MKNAGRSVSDFISVLSQTYSSTPCRFAVTIVECSLLFPSPSLFSLRVFGHEDSSGEEIGYVNWLHMVRAGLMGLEYYSPETGHWRQVGDEG